MSDPLSDVVAQQYEAWVYPEPIMNLQGWTADNWQWFDPSLATKVLWPEGPPSPELDILIAGCGANQAAVFAYMNPSARVTALEVSEASLAHERYLKDKFGLGNLELHRLPVEEVSSLGRDFDLIVSTGVLHHLAEPEVGMQALAACLRPRGVLAVMLYAHYGRIGVELMQSVFRDLGLGQDASDIATVKSALSAVPANHPVQAYLQVAPDLQFDGGIVDTFLHGRDRSYTVQQCLDLVAHAGLVFQDWYFKAPYYAAATAGEFATHVAALPARTQWSVMERIVTQNACHFFTACRPERPVDDYRIDFASGACFDYVPSFRYRCGVQGGEMYRHNWSMQLDDDQVALAVWIDGRRTIREIAELASARAAYARMDPEHRLARAAKIFQGLWQLDFVSMGTTPGQGHVPASAAKP